MTGYEYTRKIFNWSFENSDKSNPTLISLYLFLVETNNRLGWKEKFGITFRECGEACGIKSYNTYKKNFDILVKEGFIKIVQKSINQYSANIIALSKFDTPLDKALDTPLDKALDTPLDKALNRPHDKARETFLKQTNKQTTNKETIKQLQKEDFLFLIESKEFLNFLKEEKMQLKKIDEKTDLQSLYNSYNFFDSEFSEIWKEFLQVKKKKKASLTIRAQKTQLEKLLKYSDGKKEIAREILEKSVNAGWLDIYPLKENQNKKTQPEPKKKKFVDDPSIYENMKW